MFILPFTYRNPNLATCYFTLLQCSISIVFCRFLEIVQLGSSADAVDGGISSKQAVDYKVQFKIEIICTSHKFNSNVHQTYNYYLILIHQNSHTAELSKNTELTL